MLRQEKTHYRPGEGPGVHIRLSCEVPCQKKELGIHKTAHQKEEPGISKVPCQKEEALAEQVLMRRRCRRMSGEEHVVSNPPLWKEEVSGGLGPS